MKSLKLISLAIAMLFSYHNYGQEKTITGIVSDDIGPLPGANIIVKGTTRGTQTDFDGKYLILAKKGETLVFSFLGMKDQCKIVEDANTINVKLESNNLELNEVVVTAQGIKREKKAMGYAVQTVASKNLEKGYINSLSGKIAGVQITNAAAIVGSSNNRIVIGNSSITNNNRAMYVIDGIPYENLNNIKEINPDDINSFSVLKGAGATALYGSKASNGAIIITTKKGLSKSDIKKLKDKQMQLDPTNEDYDSFVENAFESPKTAPLSTFSIDVDNASYTNVRRFINAGQKVPKDAVRVEEMVNFFKYKYPQPVRDNPFSINTEYSDCPWNTNNKLVRIGLQGKNIATDDLPASNLVFLIDVSGSMSDQNKLPLLKQSLKILVNQLRDEDRISIVVYAGAAGLVLPSTSGKDKRTIINSLDNLNAGGSTAGGAGILLAYKTAEENFIKGGNNRVILATDGDFNVGSSSNSDMETLITEKRKSGVFLTCLGYGMGNYKDSKMEILADKGNGNYAYIDNIQEANRFLGKEFKGSMFAIAKDVKIQIEFNPTHVKAYRLIGYENRKLRPEDFKNDTIDAGELGSGHTVTALYEIIPRDVKSELFEEPTNLKYTIVAEPAVKNYNPELATIKFRYKKPDGDKSIEMSTIIATTSIPLESASDDFKFSAAVAWMGLKLRDSKLIINKSPEGILALANEGLSNDSEGYRAEFVRLVENVRQ
jgi:Ca-activated chloride channel homolog